MTSSRHCRLRPTLILTLLIGLIVAGLAPPASAATSSKVAYVTDFGTGSNDPCAPFSGGVCGSFPGSSIFVNALTGVKPLGTYTTADSLLTVTITDVSVSTIDANPGTALAGFDTVILYQVCDIGSHPKTMTAINNFFANGGKLLIFDADRCSGFGVLPPPANYSTFLFPFTASTPGPQGASGSYTNVQPSTLTTGLPSAPPPVVIGGGNDSVGDANNFLPTFNANWCGSITAENKLGNVGFVEAYARTPGGGLAVYEGEDFWFDFGVTPIDTTGGHQRLVFDLMLKQAFNPDGLPCALPASGISLAPATQLRLVGSSATVTATVVDANNVGQAGITVTFTVTSGPNAGLSGTGTSPTDGSGNASFTFTSFSGGTDVLHASFVDILGNPRVSNDVNVVFDTPPVALCKNVTVSTDPNTCSAVSVSIDNGSFDPDPGDTITVVQTPSGPFPLGTTTVMLTVTDNHGISSSCRATVTVVDTTPPVVTCVQSVNPSGKNIPTAHQTNEDGFFKVSGSDACGAPKITIGGIALANGETIKITQSPGKSGVTFVNTMGPLAIKHFDVGPGDAMITATDASGNTSTVTCLVPPPPK